jgi:hypothetical protein
MERRLLTSAVSLCPEADQLAIPKLREGSYGWAGSIPPATLDSRRPRDEIPCKSGFSVAGVAGQATLSLFLRRSALRRTPPLRHSATMRKSADWRVVDRPRARPRSLSQFQQRTTGCPGHARCQRTLAKGLQPVARAVERDRACYGRCRRRARVTRCGLPRSTTVLSRRLTSATALKGRTRRRLARRRRLRTTISSGWSACRS